MASFVVNRSPRWKIEHVKRRHTHTHTHIHSLSLSPLRTMAYFQMSLPFSHHRIHASAIQRINIKGITSIQFSYSVQHFWKLPHKQKRVKEDLEVKHMLVNSEQYQMEAEVANMVSVFCKRASWIDDNFSTPAGHQKLLGNHSFHTY